MVCVFFSSLRVVVPHQLATLKRACCGFFLKKQRVAANSALERLWELLSAGAAAAAGKAQTERGAVGTQPASLGWLQGMPAQPSSRILLSHCIPTLAWWWLGDESPCLAPDPARAAKFTLWVVVKGMRTCFK